MVEIVTGVTAAAVVFATVTTVVFATDTTVVAAALLAAGAACSCAALGSLFVAAVAAAAGSGTRPLRLARILATSCFSTVLGVPGALTDGVVDALLVAPAPVVTMRPPPAPPSATFTSDTTLQLSTRGKFSKRPAEQFMAKLCELNYQPINLIFLAVVVGGHLSSSVTQPLTQLPPHLKLRWRLC